MLINNGDKYQIVNINLDDVDDDFAKVITKIYSRLIFEFAKGLKERASIPFHIVVEEAHRYIQNDTDRFLIGYNIFERIAKEGRKYAVILGLISQRPVELSDTVISQCSNFLIFKMNHPVDVDYIRKMVPNISDEIVEKQKTLQAGTCLGFGMAFRIPLIVKMEMPNPAPWSGNCDVVTIWNGNGSGVSAPSAPEAVPDAPAQKTFGYNGMSDNPVFSSTNAPVSNSFVQERPVMENNSRPVAAVQSQNTAIPVNPFLEQNNNNEQLVIPKVPKVENVVSTQPPVNNGVVSIPQAPSVSQMNAPTIVNSGNMTDDMLSSAGVMSVPTIGGYSLDNQLVQSALPDFTTSSADERRMNELRSGQYFNVPSAMDMVASQGTVAPTVQLNNNAADEYGSVRIAPPVENNSVPSATMTNEAGIPVTDKGIPLINLVG